MNDIQQVRQINIKELKANLSKELLNLPFEVTRYGRVIANMVEGGHESSGKVVTTGGSSHNYSKAENTTARNNDTKSPLPTGGSLKKTKGDNRPVCSECGAMFGHRPVCSKRAA